MISFLINLYSQNFAAVSSIIPCGGKDTITGVVQRACTFCDFYVLLGNALNFLLVNIMLPLAVIVIIYAGFMMLTSRGNPAGFEKGKKALSSAVWGMVIAVIAYTVIDSILKYFVDPNFFTSGYFGFWNSFPSCPLR